VLSLDGLVLRTVVSRGRFLLLVASFSLTGCRAVDELFCNGAGCDWTDEEWARVQTLSPLPELPKDLTNGYAGNPDAERLGQQFYFDTRFSGNATLIDSIGNPVPTARAALGQPINISCSTCHDPKRAGADFTSTPTNTVSIGAGWYDVNGQQTVNAAYYPLLYWNGRADSLWAQAAQVSESGVSMNGTRLNTFWVIVNNYRSDYETLFKYSDYQLPPAPTVADYPLVGKPAADGSFPALATEESRVLVTGVYTNWAKAVAAYEMTLVSQDALFDRFVRDGPDSAWITPQAKRGARLFVGKASCIDCHNTGLLSDGLFHDIGVPQVGDHVPTVADCQNVPNTRCDCTEDEEKANCLPSGAWGGLKKLATIVDGATTNYNNFRRDSIWSDDRTEMARERQQGYYIDPPDNSMKGAWRTPSLRDVALTAPYMHDGVYKTLEEVVWHYNVGGAASGSGQFNKALARAVQIKPLGLRDDELADLVEFLKTLTGARLDLGQVTKPDAAASPPPDAGGPPDGGAPADASSQ
jgi:cytochrome c peroxidase